MKKSDPISDTLLAKVYDVAIESPLEYAPKISALYGTDIYLKREDLQPVHSFKLRGAYNKIAHLTDTQRSKGVIAASAGNHAQGVALAAQKLGLKALIIMPKTTPSIKVEAVKNYGAKVELNGDNYSEAFDYCVQRIKETGMTFIHPFDDPQVIAGQGTIGRELLEQLPDTTHIFVPVGGGGLIAGIAQYVKSLKPDIKIVGVEPVDSNAMQASLKAGKRVVLDHVGIFADGVAVKQVGELTFELTKKYVDKIVTVSTDQMCAAIKQIFEDTRSIVEPAGALAVAALANEKLPKGSKVIAICSGANMTFERLQQIAERTLISSGKEALLAVELPEKPGALSLFCEQIVGKHSITEFNYRLNNRKKAIILVGLALQNFEDKEKLLSNMNMHGYKYTDVSDDDLAKTHVRHMIGGVSANAQHEHFFQIDFPEKPGALSFFLKNIGNRWNISLFHYRNEASDNGNVFIGFESEDKTVLLKALRATKYPFEEKTKLPSIKLFL